MSNQITARRISLNVGVMAVLAAIALGNPQSFGIIAKPVKHPGFRAVDSQTDLSGFDLVQVSKITVEIGPTYDEDGGLIATASKRDYLPPKGDRMFVLNDLTRGYRFFWDADGTPAVSLFQPGDAQEYELLPKFHRNQGAPFVKDGVFVLPDKEGDVEVIRFAATVDEATKLNGLENAVGRKLTAYFGYELVCVANSVRPDKLSPAVVKWLGDLASGSVAFYDWPGTPTEDSVLKKLQQAAVQTLTRRGLAMQASTQPAKKEIADNADFDLSSDEAVCRLLENPDTALEVIEMLKDSSQRLPKGGAAAIRRAANKATGTSALKIADTLLRMDHGAYVATMVDLLVHPDPDVRHGAWANRLDGGVGKNDIDREQVLREYRDEKDPAIKKELLDGVISRDFPDVASRERSQAFLSDNTAVAGRDPKAYGVFRDAVRFGDEKTVEKMLSLGFDPTVVHVQQSFLEIAVESGNAGILQDLIKYHWSAADLGQALQRAADMGSAPCVAILVKANAIDKGRYGYATQALNITSRSGSIDCLKVLLDSGIASDVKAAALSDAKNGMVVKAFIDAGVPLDAATGPTALSIMAGKGNVDAMTALLNGGAKPDGNPRFSPMNAAARYGRLDAIKLLVAHRANVNGTGGTTPYQLATTMHHEDCAEYLKAQGGS